MGNPINFGKTKLIYHAQINCAVSKSYKFPEFTEKTISQNAYQGKECDRTHYYRNEGFFPTLFFFFNVLRFQMITTYPILLGKKQVAWDKQRFWRVIPNTFLRQKSSSVKTLSVWFEKAKNHPWKRKGMEEWQLVRFWCEKGLSILAYYSLPKGWSHHLSNWVLSWETEFMVTALELFVLRKTAFQKKQIKKEVKKLGYICIPPCYSIYINVGHP